jgi:hypothetical protein
MWVNIFSQSWMFFRDRQTKEAAMKDSSIDRANCEFVNLLTCCEEAANVPITAVHFGPVHQQRPAMASCLPTILPAMFQPIYSVNPIIAGHYMNMNIFPVTRIRHRRTKDCQPRKQRTCPVCKTTACDGAKPGPVKKGNEKRCLVTNILIKSNK